MSKTDEIDDCWRDLFPPPSPIDVVTDRPSDVRSQFVIATEMAIFDLNQKAKSYVGQILTPEMLSDIASKGVRIFIEKWYDELHKHDLTGLLEIVLETQRLSPEDMHSFLRALPDSFLDRCFESAYQGANGTHALLAIERHRRNGRIQGYTLERDSQGIVVSFVDPSVGNIALRLSEFFKGISSEAK